MLILLQYSNQYEIHFATPFVFAESETAKDDASRESHRIDYYVTLPLGRPPPDKFIEAGNFHFRARSRCITSS